VIEKRNVIKDHNQYFQVNYHYSRLSILHEPFLVAGAFFAFFLAIIFYVRFEISIKPEDLPAIDLKNSKAVVQFKEHISKFDQEYKALQHAFKTITDSPAFKQERNRIISLYLNKILTDASNVASGLVRSNPQLAEKFQDVVNYEHERLRSRIDLQDLEIEFKTGGSKGKSKYDKEYEELEKKYNEAVDGVETLLSEVSYYI